MRGAFERGEKRLLNIARQLCEKANHHEIEIDPVRAIQVTQDRTIGVCDPVHRVAQDGLRNARLIREIDMTRQT